MSRSASAVAALPLSLPPDDLAPLEAAARVRNIGVTTLALRILQTVSAERLVVLDDRGDPAPPAETNESLPSPAIPDAVAEAAEIARMIAAGADPLEAMRELAERSGGERRLTELDD